MKAYIDSDALIWHLFKALGFNDLLGTY